MNRIISMMKVSIIITYYKGEKSHFIELLKTIKKNVKKYIFFIDFELIIIDDSDDNVYEGIMKEVIGLVDISDFADLKVIINEKNMGVVYSRFVGLKEVTGDCFFIVDQDDCYMDIEYDKLAHKSDDLIVFDGNKIDENSLVINSGLHKCLNKKRIKKHLNDLFIYYYSGNQIITPGIICFKRRVLNDLIDLYRYMFECQAFEAIDDYYMYIYLLIKGYSFDYCDESYFCYRLHNNNRRNRTRSLNKIKNSIKYFFDFSFSSDHGLIFSRVRFLFVAQKNIPLAILRYPLSAMRYIYGTYL